jgi:hypothetical protein
MEKSIKEIFMGNILFALKYSTRRIETSENF